MGAPAYVPTPYLDRMDLAYAAADLIVARSGAMTVAEIGALRIPVVYVPLAFGNGEQRLNAAAAEQSGAAVIIDQDDLTPAVILERIVPLVKDREALAKMHAAAAGSQGQNADELLARIVLTVADRARSKTVR